MADTSLIAVYLDQIGSQLTGRRSVRTLAEIEDHLGERVADLLAEDHDPDEAERSAIEAFGEPEVVASSLNDVGGAMPSKLTHWSGLLGMIGPVILVTMFALISENGTETPFHLFVPAFCLLAGCAGLVARTRGAFGRWRGAAIVVLTVCALALAPAAWGLLGWIVALMLLLAAALICDVIFREDVLPRPATLLLIGSVVALSALSPTSLQKQSVPYYALGAALVVGWIWLQYTLWSERPERAVVSAA